MTNELQQKIESINKKLHELSNIIASERDNDKINWAYLNDKAIGMLNTAKHVKGQIKHLKKS